MKKIGFIGTGVMGQAIVRHLRAAGYEVHVYNRTPEKAAALIEEGAIWQPSPAAVTQNSAVIFTMVGYPADVKAVYFGPEGIFTTLTPGQILIDLTTSTPALAGEIAEKAQERGASALDSPVSGGDIGAKNGTLTLMVGGTEASFREVRPLLEKFSQKQMYHGAAGCGQHAKMANQIMVAGTMLGMTEVLAYSKAAGLDLPKVIETLSGGAAGNWSLTNYGPRILQADYSAGFFVKHFVKDLKIALAESQKMAVRLPMTALAEELYEQLANDGYENAGTQALIRLWWG